MSSKQPIPLFTDQAADGDSEIYELPISQGPGSDARVRTYHVVAEGDFGGGAFTIEWRRETTGTFIDTGVSISSDGMATVVLGRGQIKGVLTGSTNPDLDASIDG